MRNGLDEEQKAFIRKHASKGGKWISEALGVNRQEVYNLGHREGFSVKKEKELKLKTSCSSWPKQYRRYKNYLVMRDGLTCHYCHDPITYKEAQIDHVKAKARGGTDAPHNLVLACKRCNAIKSTLCYECPEFREAITQ